jgi:hypothetical protein
MVVSSNPPSPLYKRGEKKVSDNPLCLERLCSNMKNSMFVILNPSPTVTLSPAWVILSEAKDLGLLGGVNSAKGFRESISYKTEILPCLSAGKG